MQIGHGDYGSEMRLTFAVKGFEDRETYFALRNIMDRDKVPYTTEVVFGPPASRTLVIPLTTKAGVFWHITRKYRNWFRRVIAKDACDVSRDKMNLKKDILGLVAEEQAKQKQTKPKGESDCCITARAMRDFSKEQLEAIAASVDMKLEYHKKDTYAILEIYYEEAAKTKFCNVCGLRLREAPTDPGINYCQMRIRTVITPDGKRVEGLEPLTGKGLEGDTTGSGGLKRRKKMHKVTLVEEVVVRALRKRLNEIPDMVWGFARKMRLGEDIEGAVRKILRYGIADEPESKTKQGDCCDQAVIWRAGARAAMRPASKSYHRAVHPRRQAMANAKCCLTCGKPLGDEED